MSMTDEEWARMTGATIKKKPKPKPKAKKKSKEKKKPTKGKRVRDKVKSRMERMEEAAGGSLTIRKGKS